MKKTFMFVDSVIEKILVLEDKGSRAPDQSLLLRRHNNVMMRMLKKTVNKFNFYSTVSEENYFTQSSTKTRLYYVILRQDLQNKFLQLEYLDVDSQMQ